MSAPACPDSTRRCHASAADMSCSAAGISRVAFVPRAWHAQQVPDFRVRSHSAWFLMSGEMPLPDGPVPGNSLLSGTFISENQ